ncbi:MAG: DUF4388 domain-containing protein [Planctomycetes bacterium]|nr:DUF4388 domain-containing protein [Planctomycetota bacterium]
MRVLLVDNLIAYRQKMKGWIVDIGGRPDDVLEAGTGDEALELMAHNNYSVDVVVCEWDDDSVNGQGLVESLRKNPATTRIGFVAVCGNDPAAIRSARGAGANEVVVKPVNQVDVLKALSEVQKSLKPRTDDTRKRLQAAASVRQQSTKLSSTIATELRNGGKLGKYKREALIADGPFRNRLSWVESGCVFVRETRGDGNEIEYRATPGKFFGEAAFAGEPIVNLHAVAESECIVGWQEKDAVAQTIQRLPILQHYFRTITAERYRNNVVVELPDEGGAGALKGTLESLPFPDLMQMMTVTKKTGVLRVESGGEVAVLHLSAGALRHAEIGPKTGDDVVFKVVTWAGGRFQFTPQLPENSPATIHRDSTALLMEGLRRRDAGE